MSKGSTQRPCDKKRFNDNFDKIFKSDTDIARDIANNIEVDEDGKFTFADVRRARNKVFGVEGGGNEMET